MIYLGVEGKLFAYSALVEIAGCGHLHPAYRGGKSGSSVCGKHGDIHLSVQRLRHGGGEAAYGSNTTSLVQWEREVIPE